jgi:5'-methylthioadenosine phosphorylase
MNIGVIGGSGLYAIEGLSHRRERAVTTPFGAPSDTIVEGQMGGRTVFFLPRHGRGHRILPSEINHRANVYAMKTLGVQQLVSISAVGSLKEAYRPRDIVLPDQYYDRTKDTAGHTFFGDGVVAHIAFAEPACAALRACAAAAARKTIGSADPRVHEGGIYVNMAGPAFSTRAESRIYRGLGCDVIGMTSLPEAKLCREAEICYQALAMVTDYDAWHTEEEAVSVEMLIGHLTANTALAKAVLTALIPALPVERDCPCACALAGAVFTEKTRIPPQRLHDLAPIIGSRLDASAGA